MLFRICCSGRAGKRNLLHLHRLHVNLMVSTFAFQISLDRGAAAEHAAIALLRRHAGAPAGQDKVDFE